MINKRPLIIFAVMAFMSAAQPGFASGDGGWEARLIVSAGVAENRLALGQKQDATDGVDNQYDVPPMTGGGVNAQFACEGSSLWRDIKAASNQPKTWSLRIDTTQAGETVVVLWDPKDFPKDGNAVLTDPSTNKTINMKAKDRYVYVHDGPRELEIEVSR